MTASSMTTFAALLKERYLDSSIVEKLTYPDNPLLGMLEKKGDTGMVGSRLPVPFFTRNGQGVAAQSLALAQTNSTATASDEFNIEAGNYYGVVQINDKAIKAARNNAGAFLEHKRIEIDSLYETMGEMLSIHAWGNGGGALGRLASIATNNFTLTQPEQAANFEPGMTVVASAADGSAAADALRDSGDQTVVTSINRATGEGVLLLASDISGLVAGDYLFREGDFFGDTGTIAMKGLQAFLSATDAPAALWGITAATRATDPQRYAGCRVAPADIAGMQMDERIKTLLAYMTGRFKAKTPTAGFLHPEDFLRLESLMAGTGLRSLPDDSTKFGFRKIDIVSPTSSGSVPIYLDRHCPKGTFFALRMDNWWVSSMGELMHPMTGDGNEILRMATTTDYEFRLLSYPLLACNAPKNSGRVSLI
jgi:hypothetical protein